MYKHVLNIAKEFIAIRVKDSYIRLCKDTARNKDLQSFSYFLHDPQQREDEEGYAHIITRIPLPSEDDAPSNENINWETWVKKQVSRKLGELLIRTLNKEGHTPGTLAAKLGKHRMLELLCEGDFQWSYGPLTVSRINLDGFEKPIDKSHYIGEINAQVYR
jgi:hypothetical protein